MKWVVLGDIGQRDYYHLGDEAMTEVAVEMLENRGASEITLIASDPLVATELYALPAIARLDFRFGAPREELERRLAEASGSPNSSSGSLLSGVDAALSRTDFALIAGGGNMNSIYPHLLYERLAFARMAQRHGVPLFVTSQTVGPTLRERDVELVTELLRIATAFGAREKHTAQLLRELTSSPEKVVHTFDDAVLLAARSIDLESVARHGFQDRPIVASFAAELGTSGLQEEEYVERLATLLDELAYQHDKQVVLVPHAGALKPQKPTPLLRDQALNQRIAEKSRGLRVVVSPMLTARESVAVMETASLSISSRYHPVVFGPQAGIPSVGIALSKYSSVRMRGALANVGLEKFVVPSALWGLVTECCSEAISRGAGSLSPKVSVEYQRAWWDRIFAAAKEGSWTGMNDLPAPEVLSPTGAWSTKVEAATPAFEKWSESVQLLEWAETDLFHWRDRALASEQRRITRMVDRFARIYKGKVQ